LTNIIEKDESRWRYPSLLRFFERLLGFAELARIWLQAINDGPTTSAFKRALDLLSIRLECSDTEIARLPASGPTILVANHPHGIVDGLAVASLLVRQGREFRFLANSRLLAAKGLDEFVIPINVFDESAPMNALAMRTALQWLKAGGVLVVFPAGEVSATAWFSSMPRDRDWNESVVRIAALANATLVPMYISGRNSTAFYLSGLVHPRLRTALLGREVLKKRGQVIRVAIGRPVTAGHGVVSPDYLRARTYLLRGRMEGPDKPLSLLTRPDLTNAVDPTCLERCLRVLRPNSLLLRSGRFVVYVAGGSEMDFLLREIGRLRELTFHRAGEGTGRSTDLDRFDQHYRHLFVWNGETREIIGAYRIGLVDEIVGRSGMDGLYTNTLFRLNASFLSKVSPGIELGRSFVRPEYQKKPQTLYLLWRGIAIFLAQHPQYRYLFGPVSISANYSRTSRELIVSYFQMRMKPNTIRVRARSPFLVTPLAPEFARSLSLRNVDDLSEVITDIEPDHKGLPVLLRRYLNLGCEVVEFNLDRSFSDALDALIVVDLLSCPQPVLAKCFGHEIPPRIRGASTG
jgi:putative hemolysin